MTPAMVRFPTPSPPYVARSDTGLSQAPTRFRPPEAPADIRLSRVSQVGRNTPPLRASALLLLLRRGKCAGLGLAEAVQEKRVVGNGLFDELLKEEQLGTVDDCVHALLKRLHWREGLKGIAEEDERGVAALGHLHVLNGMQREILGNIVGRKKLLDDDHLVLHLAEADDKIAVSSRRVDFVSQLVEGRAGGVEPFRSLESQERGLVRGTDEIELVGHTI